MVWILGDPTVDLNCSAVQSQQPGGLQNPRPPLALRPMATQPTLMFSTLVVFTRYARPHHDVGANPQQYNTINTYWGTGIAACHAGLCWSSSSRRTGESRWTHTDSSENGASPFHPEFWGSKKPFIKTLLYLPKPKTATVLQELYERCPCGCRHGQIGQLALRNEHDHFNYHS